MKLNPFARKARAACIRCHRLVARDTKFCPSCGTEQPVAQQQPAPGAAPQSTDGQSPPAADEEA